MVSLLQIIENVVAAISPGGGGLTGLMFILSWIIGIVLVMKAISGAGKRSEMGKSAGSWSTPMWTFIIGVCFVALPGLSQTLAMTFFAVETPPPESIFSYAPSTVGLFDSGSPGRTMIVGLVTIIQFIGFIGIMRGLLILREVSEGGGRATFGSGLTFVIAGSMAINFPLFVGMIELLITTTPATP